MKAWIQPIFLGLLFLFSSCTKETVFPDVFGDIEGKVINSDSNQPLSKVSITTNPATNAILTEEDGSFFLDDVPTGNYSIQARKKGFSNTTVTVTVRDSRPAVASIVMNPTEDKPVTTIDDLQPEVVNWFNTTSNDSSFAEVEYRVTNQNHETAIGEYKIYFEIVTDEASFYKEVSGTELKQGQTRYGQFSRYIQNYTATDVIVNDVWVSKY